MLPRNQVNPKLVEKFKAEERAKRREFLNKFVHKCSAAQVLYQQITFCAFQLFDFVTSFYNTISPSFTGQCRGFDD